MRKLRYKKMPKSRTSMLHEIRKRTEQQPHPSATEETGRWRWSFILPPLERWFGMHREDDADRQRGSYRMKNLFLTLSCMNRWLITFILTNKYGRWIFVRALSFACFRPIFIVGHPCKLWADLRAEVLDAKFGVNLIIWTSLRACICKKI